MAVLLKSNPTQTQQKQHYKLTHTPFDPATSSKIQLMIRTQSLKRKIGGKQSSSIRVCTRPLHISCAIREKRAQKLGRKIPSTPKIVRIESNVRRGSELRIWLRGRAWRLLAAATNVIVAVFTGQLYLPPNLDAGNILDFMQFRSIYI